MWTEAEEIQATVTNICAVQVLQGGGVSIWKGHKIMSHIHQLCQGQRNDSPHSGLGSPSPPVVLEGTKVGLGTGQV